MVRATNSTRVPCPVHFICGAFGKQACGVQIRRHLQRLLATRLRFRAPARRDEHGEQLAHVLDEAIGRHVSQRRVRFVKGESVGDPARFVQFVNPALEIRPPPG